jgi:hypothetical protein
VADNTEAVQIDTAALEKEIQGLSTEELKAQLLSVRTRQKVQQKKNYDPERMKAYQLKSRAKFRAMKEAAIKLGIWDSINQAAETAAEAKLTEEAGATDEAAE